MIALIVGVLLVLFAPLPFDLVGVLIALAGIGILFEEWKPNIGPRYRRPRW